jgi:hypothetical protein
MDQTLNTLLDGYGAASEAGPCPRYIYQGQRGFREPGMHATLVDGVAWIDEQEELKSSGNNLLSSSKPSFGSGQLPGSDQRLSRPRAACVPYTHWTAFSRISGSSSVRHLVVLVPKARLGRPRSLVLLHSHHPALCAVFTSQFVARKIVESFW